MSHENPTLAAFKSFAFGTGSLVAAQRLAKADASDTAAQVLAFFTKYENSEWTVGQTRDEARKLIGQLESRTTDWKVAEPMMWRDGYDARKREEPREQGIDPREAKAAWQAGWDVADAELSPGAGN